MTGRKLPLIAVALAVLIAIIYSQRASLALTLMDRVASQRVATDVLAELPDGLHVILCGAGGPLPDPERSGPCVAVVAGSTLVIVDSGTGGVRNLNRMQINAGNIDTLLLTHFHSDHIDGLGEIAMMRWVNAANQQPLPVIGPTGVDAVVDGFNRAYQADAVYRNEHHTDLVAPLSGSGMKAVAFEPPAKGVIKTVYEKQGLTISTFSVDHAPVSPAVGYRFDYKGRSAVISGDTSKSMIVEKVANGVDLLVHEALAPHLVNIMHNAATKVGNVIAAKITHDILDYHASPVEAAETASAADVGYLLYYHVVPPLIAPGMEAAFLAGVSDVYDGRLSVGVDGSMISLPANADSIISDQRM